MDIARRDLDKAKAGLSHLAKTMRDLTNRTLEQASELANTRLTLEKTEKELQASKQALWKAREMATAGDWTESSEAGPATNRSGVVKQDCSMNYIKPGNFSSPQTSGISLKSHNVRTLLRFNVHVDATTRSSRPLS